MPKIYNSLNIDYKRVLKGSYARMLVGQVKTINEKTGNRKVACLKLSLDPKLLIYYNARRMFRVLDEANETQYGDIVLISQLERPLADFATHKIEEIVFKNGAVIDPMSGKPCHGPELSESTHNPNFEKYMQQKRQLQSESEV